jgi:hypothetical protein
MSSLQKVIDWLREIPSNIPEDLNELIEAALIEVDSLRSQEITIAEFPQELTQDQRRVGFLYINPPLYKCKLDAIIATIGINEYATLHSLQFPRELFTFDEQCKQAVDSYRYYLDSLRKRISELQITIETTRIKRMADSIVSECSILWKIPKYDRLRCAVGILNMFDKLINEPSVKRFGDCSMFRYAARDAITSTICWGYAY